MRTYICLAISVLIAGCSAGTMPSEDSAPGRSDVATDGETAVGAPRITSAQAVEIGLKRLRTEAFADDIDPKRMTVHYGKFGPTREAPVRWVVDFARRGSPEITPGLWARGYHVIVDTDSGAVIEASAYER